MITLRTESYIVDVSLTLKSYSANLLGIEEVEERLIFRLLIDLQHPTVLITFESDDEGLIMINAGPLSSEPLGFLSNILKHSPPTDHVSLNVNQDVERLIKTLGLVDDF